MLLPGLRNPLQVTLSLALARSTLFRQLINIRLRSNPYANREQLDIMTLPHIILKMAPSLTPLSSSTDTHNRKQSEELAPVNGKRGKRRRARIFASAEDGEVTVSWVCKRRFAFVCPNLMGAWHIWSAFTACLQPCGQDSNPFFGTSRRNAVLAVILF